MTYLTATQHAQLLRAINPKRVSQDGKGFSHVEAYEIKAHLNRVFGFARWSADVIDQQVVFEDPQPRQSSNGKNFTAWSVCYRTILRLTVCAPDGTVLATYTEGATGEAKNQPSRGDAHDLALKTSESQALKRCAINLGDNYGLSLYAKGSQAALVRQTLITPDETEPDAPPVDRHITEQLPREDAPAEPTSDPRVTNRPAVESPLPAGPAAAGVADPPRTPAAAPTEAEQQDATEQAAQRIRAQALEAPVGNWPRSRHITRLTMEASKQRLLTVRVESLNSPNLIPLKLFLEECLKRAADEERAARAS